MGGIASNLADYVEAGNKTTIHNQDTFTEKEDLEEVLDCTFEEFKDENGNLSWSEIGQKFNGMGFGHIFNALEEKNLNMQCEIILGCKVGSSGYGPCIWTVSWQDSLNQEPFSTKQNA